ncbi:MAG: helix-turn-helix transcriptional regulator [Rhodospirillales bacterium]|nr:helix-turn-helix transcriptional regulator [Rhodospirillales bacterium]
MTQKGQRPGQPTLLYPDGFDPGEVLDPALPVLGFARDEVAYDTGWHNHLRGQLLFAIRGVMTVRTRSGTWIVPPQQAVWVPAGTEHAVLALREVAMRSLYLDPSVTEGLPQTCSVFSVSPFLRELILKVVALGRAYPSDGPEARLVAVVPDEFRRLKPEPLHLPLPDDARLASVTQALIDNPGDRRDLGDWAQEAGASERTLARLFQKETGMTFGAWRQRRRLQAAIERLAAGDPVTTVALDLGYDSPSAFITMFRRSLGETPGRYLAREG